MRVWDTVAGGVEGVLGGGIAIVVVVTVEVAVLAAVWGVSLVASHDCR